MNRYNWKWGDIGSVNTRGISVELPADCPFRFISITTSGEFVMPNFVVFDRGEAMTMTNEEALAYAKMIST